MARALETGIYLLTATHVGTGQAAGAVDLPIARERHTGHPLLPASALKGVLRDRFESGSDLALVKKLFGPEPPQKGEVGDSLFPGDLVFTDGHLLAFPVRSLSAAFYWVTCPQIIGRWRRLRGAWSLPVGTAPVPVGQASSTFAHPGPLVLEDHVVTTSGFGSAHAALKEIASQWAALAPAGDDIARALPERLISVSDADFAHLVHTCTTVSARVQLTPGKTTDEFVDENGKPWKGNLWYEETLPPDCLFSALVGTRKGTTDAVSASLGAAGAQVQIGGNETIGQGISWWRPGAEVSGG